MYNYGKIGSPCFPSFVRNSPPAMCEHRSSSRYHKLLPLPETMMMFVLLIGFRGSFGSGRMEDGDGKSVYEYPRLKKKNCTSGRILLRVRN